MVIKKKKTANKCLKEDMGKLNLLCTASRNVNGVTAVESSMIIPQRVKHS